jgi:hypothetical protein
MAGKLNRDGIIGSRAVQAGDNATSSTHICAYEHTTAYRDTFGPASKK